VLSWSFICARAGGEVTCMRDLRSTGEGVRWQKITEFTDAVQLVGGWDHACVLRRTGAIACMGNLRYTFVVDRTPEWGDWTTIAELTDAVSLMPGRGSHACAMRRGGEVRCWGIGFSGELGHGLHQPWRRPVAVIGMKGPRALVGGGSHTCALTGAREVLCWGANGSGQLGWEPAEKIEVPDLQPGRSKTDPIASQLRGSIRDRATPVRALQLP
jgi:alpha-tubulin suppressor-like RCC1 family protein